MFKTELRDKFLLNKRGDESNLIPSTFKVPIPSTFKVNLYLVVRRIA